MKKTTAAFAALTMIMATPVVAGEVNGNGGVAQGASHASSECAYSGLNDTPWDPMGLVQTFKTWWNIFGFVMPGEPYHPGQACRG